MADVQQHWKPPPPTPVESSASARSRYSPGALNVTVVVGFWSSGSLTRSDVSANSTWPVPRSRCHLSVNAEPRPPRPPPRPSAASGLTSDNQTLSSTGVPTVAVSMCAMPSRWTGEPLAVLGKTDRGWLVAVRGVSERLDEVGRAEVRRNGRGLVVCDQGPGEIAIEVTRHLYRQDTPASTGHLRTHAPLDCDSYPAGIICNRGLRKAHSTPSRQDASHSASRAATPLRDSPPTVECRASWPVGFMYRRGSNVTH